jgi:phage baseplate assembly protein W
VAPEALDRYHESRWRGTLFPMGKDGDPIATGDDLALVFSSILQILNTRRGERVMYPEFGSDLGRFLWEPHDPLLQREVAGNIQRAISLWEPRAHVEAVTFGATDLEKNQGILNVSITLRLVNNPRVTQTVLVPISSQGTLFA